MNNSLQSKYERESGSVSFHVVAVTFDSRGRSLKI